MVSRRAHYQENPMPNAPTHDAITLVTGAVLAPVAYLSLASQGNPHPDAMAGTLVLTAAHIISGVLFSPDLDIDSAIDNRWGILWWIWRPYMWAIPHRHFWSHSLIVAPLLRLVYFYTMICGLLWIMSLLLQLLGVVSPRYASLLGVWLWSLIQVHPQETLCVLVGFVTGGAAHSIADWLVTGGKQLLRRLGIRVVRNYDYHDNWPRRNGARRRRTRMET
jgi:uncharacterized metal-binding protein